MIAVAVALVLTLVLAVARLDATKFFQCLPDTIDPRGPKAK